MRHGCPVGQLERRQLIPNGFTAIRATFTVAGDAPPEKLREVVTRATQRSAVYDTLTSGVAVDVQVLTP